LIANLIIIINASVYTKIIDFLGKINDINFMTQNKAIIILGKIIKITLAIVIIIVLRAVHNSDDLAIE